MTALAIVTFGVCVALVATIAFAWSQSRAAQQLYRELADARVRGAQLAQAVAERDRVLEQLEADRQVEVRARKRAEGALLNARTGLVRNGDTAAVVDAINDELLALAELSEAGARAAAGTSSGADRDRLGTVFGTIPSDGPRRSAAEARIGRNGQSDS